LKKWIFQLATHRLPEPITALFPSEEGDKAELVWESAAGKVCAKGLSGNYQ